MRRVFEKDLIDQFFRLGLVGIEVPEQYGGGDKFFDVTLAVEELSRVDLYAGIVVNGQNMLVNNALLRWANEGRRNANCLVWLSWAKSAAKP